MSDSQSPPFDPAEELLARRRGRDDIGAFVRYTMPTFQENWHHAVIFRALSRLVNRQARRVMVFAPPRHTKSETGSRRLPAYLMGAKPGAQIIATSHTMGLAGDMSRDVRGIMQSEEYAALFPSAALPGRRTPGLRTTIDNWNAPNGSVYRASGIGGPIVGKGFDFGLIDDPVKDAEEAYSETIRKRNKNWYSTTFRTRRQPDASILIMLTRWHPDDLAGWLLQEQDNENADRWEVYDLPAISDDKRPEYDLRTAPGQALWPGWFNLADLNAQKAAMIPSQWAALYQQRPTIEGGNHFKADWFPRSFYVLGDYWHLGGDKYYHPSMCPVYVTIDPASSEKNSADYTVFLVTATTPHNDLIILDCIRERVGIAAFIPRLQQICAQYNPQWVACEATGFQSALTVAARLKAGMPPIRELSHEGKGKLVRASPAIIKACAGQINLPKTAPWIQCFLDELCEFTGIDDTHDDQVDALAYAVRQMSLVEPSRKGPPTPPEGRRSPYPSESNAQSRGMWGRT